MIPSSRLVLLGAAPVVGAFAVMLEPGWWPAWLVWNGATGLIAWMDRRWGAVDLSGVRAHREVERRQLVGKAFDVRLRLEGLPGPAEVTDDVPLPQEPQTHEVKSEETSEVVDRWCWGERGVYAFGGVEVRVPSRGGLWTSVRRVVPEGTQEVVVGLDGGPLRGRSVGRASESLSTSRLDKPRRLGGGEFEQMRWYVPGDPWRHIDWKVSARHRRLTVRQFGERVSQDVVVWVDSGHRMTQRLGERQAFDAALDAGLALTWAALGRGDRVGWLVSDREVRWWTPPRSGHGQGVRVLRGLERLQPRSVASDATKVLQTVMRSLRGRTLIVWVSNADDGASAARAQAVAEAVRGRHALVAVWLQDPRMERYLGGSDPSEVDQRAIGSWARVAAADLVLRQRDGVRALRRRGVWVVESPPDAVGDRLCARYRDLKARRLL